VIALLAAGSWAGSTLGVGLAGGFDLPGPDGGEFGIAPGLYVPVVVGLSPQAGLRITARFEGGPGTDEVSWAESVNGTPSRIVTGSDFALVLSAIATIGPDLEIPTGGPVAPYFGAEIGGGVAGVYHSLGGPTAFLIDPAQNDLEDPGNIDPYTVSPVLASDLHFGARSTSDEGLGWWAELGYDSTWIGAAPLKKSLPVADARREGIGWNPIRIGVGISFAL
jgi:hypothetical protein